MSTKLIWDQFQNRLYVFIRNRVSAAEDADDVLQNVFEKIHKHANQLPDIVNINGWLFRITRNEIVNYYRQRSKLPDALVEPSGDALNQPAIPKEPREFRNRVDAVDGYEFLMECMSLFMRNLKEDEREILMLISTGTSLKAIALQTNRSYSAVKSTARRARQRLRRQFVQCCNITSMRADTGRSDSACNQCPA